MLRERIQKPGKIAILLLATGLLCVKASAQQNNLTVLSPGTSQTQESNPPRGSGPPLTITLQDALARAQKNSPIFQAAVTALKLARENRIQANAAMLPAVSARTEYLNTQGNGISPVGRFVTNDGVHVYRAWGVITENMPGSFFIKAGPRSAAYLEAEARANREIAQRGLNVTVTTDYYALVVAERAYATAQQTVADARRFVQIAQALERGGEVAQADVIRFQLQFNQAQQTLENANVAMTSARLNLAVLLFPTLNQDFTVVDDLGTPPVLPGFREIQALAQHNNPQIRAALAAYHQARLNVSVARSAFYPSISLQLDYGIEANAFALESVNLTAPHVRQPNLGYFATYTVNLPIWDWGALRSKLHQAEDQRSLAKLNFSFAQRQLLSQLYMFYNEAEASLKQLDTLRNSARLAAHNLQLVTMQYKAGETNVLSVLDAENSLAGAKNAYAAGEARYRTALANLQTLTGSF